MSGCIYYIHCKETNKGYVGQHCLPSPERRWREHWTYMNRYDLPLYYAFRKYGRDAFTIETLCVVPLEALGRMEMYWAEQFETYVWDTPGGYNAVWCGDNSRLGITATPETCEKLSKSLKEYFTDPEARKRRSEASKETWENNPEARKKWNESMKNVWSDTDVRLKLSKCMTKRFENLDERKKTSEATKKAMANPLIRNKVIASNKNRPLPGLETRNKHSKSMKEQWTDPEARKRRVDSLKTVCADPEYRKKQSESMKAVWARRKAMKNSCVTTETTV